MLPGLSGRQVHERLRANPGTARLPVIFITAERGDDVSDLLGPHTYYLRKAIDLGALKKLVTDVTSGKSRA
jgi:CheY-like chemotaxis protein